MDDPLVSGASNAWSIACDGEGHLFVATYTLAGTNGGRIPDTAYIGLYDANNGSVINRTLITGLDTPWIALDGKGHLYVANKYRGTVDKFATDGTPIRTNLVTGLSFPSGIAFDGAGHFFVSSTSAGTIGKYDEETGVAVSVPLISGLSGPQGLAIGSNGHLYVALNLAGTIAEYTTDGQLVNSKVFNFGNPEMLAILPDTKISLAKYVQPSFENLLLGTNYQLQISTDASLWTNYGTAFTATNANMRFPEFWAVESWDKLFFRVQLAP